MTNGVKFRLALWAVTGAVIAFGWGLYFASADKATPIGPIVFTLAAVTVPVAGLVSYFHLTFGVTASVVWNTGTYAVIGLIVEMIRRQLQPVRSSN
jgi:hypothetical protein